MLDYVLVVSTLTVKWLSFKLGALDDNAEKFANTSDQSIREGSRKDTL